MGGRGHPGHANSRKLRGLTSSNSRCTAEGNDPFGQHLSTAIREVAIAEVYYGIDTSNVMSSYRAFAGVASAVDGHIEASDAPGFGFEFDLNAIERSTS